MIHLTDKTLTEPIAIIGVQIRTNNARELSGQTPGPIGALWGRWFDEDLAARIPHRVSQSIFSVYSNYDSDENGDYDYLLGCPVSTIENLPQGMTYAAIPTGDYAVFTTETGPVVEVIQAAWKHIWALAPGELGRKRAFLTDYEVYDHRAIDPANAQVEIHLSLQSANES
jgi:predicted transcriptional regulator YdeE